MLLAQGPLRLVGAKASQPREPCARPGQCRQRTAAHRADPRSSGEARRTIVPDASSPTVPWVAAAGLPQCFSTAHSLLSPPISGPVKPMSRISLFLSTSLPRLPASATLANIPLIAAQALRTTSRLIHSYLPVSFGASPSACRPPDGTGPYCSTARRPAPSSLRVVHSTVGRPPLTRCSGGRARASGTKTVRCPSSIPDRPARARIGSVRSSTPARARSFLVDRRTAPPPVCGGSV